MSIINEVYSKFGDKLDFKEIHHSECDGTIDTQRSLILLNIDILVKNLSVSILNFIKE